MDINITITIEAGWTLRDLVDKVLDRVPIPAPKPSDPPVDVWQPASSPPPRPSYDLDDDVLF